MNRARQTRCLTAEGVEEEEENYKYGMLYVIYV
jgi:hypothetical protein